MMSGKIHRATVTEANLDYEGSITLDPDLMEAAGILPYEQVHVLDVTNGARLETYAIRGPPRHRRSLHQRRRRPPRPRGRHRHHPRLPAVSRTEAARARTPRHRLRRRPEPHRPHVARRWRFAQPRPSGPSSALARRTPVRGGHTMSRISIHKLARMEGRRPALRHDHRLRLPVGAPRRAGRHPHHPRRRLARQRRPRLRIDRPRDDGRHPLSHPRRRPRDRASRSSSPTCRS